MKFIFCFNCFPLRVMVVGGIFCFNIRSNVYCNLQKTLKFFLAMHRDFFCKIKTHAKVKLQNLSWFPTFICILFSKDLLPEVLQLLLGDNAITTTHTACETLKAAAISWSRSTSLCARRQKNAWIEGPGLYGYPLHPKIITPLWLSISTFSWWQIYLYCLQWQPC